MVELEKLESLNLQDEVDAVISEVVLRLTRFICLKSKSITSQRATTNHQQMLHHISSADNDLACSAQMGKSVTALALVTHPDGQDIIPSEVLAACKDVTTDVGNVEDATVDKSLLCFRNTASWAETC